MTEFYGKKVVCIKIKIIVISIIITSRCTLYRPTAASFLPNFANANVA